MQIREVSFDEFKKYSKSSKVVFNSADFIDNNRKKVDEIKYLIIFKEFSARFFVSFGVKDGDYALCPFSAPFSYIEPIKSGMGINDYEEAIIALDEYFKELKISKAAVTFPPVFYDKNNITAWIQIMIRNNWKIDYVDISYGFCLREIMSDYQKKIARNARKNLRIALESNLSIVECVNEDDCRVAYQVIKINRESKGYPLRMTEKQVLQTMKIVPSKMFLVKDNDNGDNVASALIYNVTNKVAQVIYWGDVPGVSKKKVINFLAYQLTKIYSEMGYEYLDIGPSTENGIPNYGLCDFKESIGCERSMKFKLYKEYF